MDDPQHLHMPGCRVGDVVRGGGGELRIEGGRYSGTQMARRRSRANVIWEMSAKTSRHLGPLVFGELGT